MVINMESKIYFENNIIKRQCLYYYGFKTKKEFINNNYGGVKYIINYNINDFNLKKYEKKYLCYDINFKKDELHGICNYYVFGIIKYSSFFSRGILNGLCKKFKINGIDEIINYENNLKNGLFMKFNSLKKLKIVGNYKQNKLHGIIMFFVNNTIIKTINMDNGNINGHYNEYNQNKKEYIFKDNLLYGYSEYSYSGTIKYKLKFIENRFANIYKKYNIYGKLDKEILFLGNDYIVKQYNNDKVIYSLYKFNNNYYFSFNNTKIKLG